MKWDIVPNQTHYIIVDTVAIGSKKENNIIYKYFTDLKPLENLLNIFMQFLRSNIPVVTVSAFRPRSIFELSDLVNSNLPLILFDTRIRNKNSYNSLNEAILEYNNKIDELKNNNTEGVLFKYEK